MNPCENGASLEMPTSTTTQEQPEEVSFLIRIPGVRVEGGRFHVLTSQGQDHVIKVEGQDGPLEENESFESFFGNPGMDYGDASEFIWIPDPEAATESLDEVDVQNGNEVVVPMGSSSLSTMSTLTHLENDLQNGNEIMVPMGSSRSSSLSTMLTPMTSFADTADDCVMVTDSDSDQENVDQGAQDGSDNQDESDDDDNDGNDTDSSSDDSVQILEDDDEEEEEEIFPHGTFVWVPGLENHLNEQMGVVVHPGKTFQLTDPIMELTIPSMVKDSLGYAVENKYPVFYLSNGITWDLVPADKMRLFP